MSEDKSSDTDDHHRNQSHKGKNKMRFRHIILQLTFIP
jgi:hypothetical protein